MGFTVEGRGASHDGGIDFIATTRKVLSGGKSVVQCKDWDEAVGEPVVRDLYGTMLSEGANTGILITTSRFTPSAYRFADGKPLELIDGEQFVALCVEHDLTPNRNNPNDTEHVFLSPQSNNVRITSIDSSDRNEAREFQEYVFQYGQLVLNDGLSFVSAHGSFNFSACRVIQVESTLSVGIEPVASTISLTFYSPPKSENKFVVCVEGYYDLIASLKVAANANLKRYNQFSFLQGCFPTVLAVLGVVVVCLLFGCILQRVR